MPPRRRSARLAPLALAFVLAALPEWAGAAAPSASGRRPGRRLALDARIDQEAQKVAPQLVEVRHRIHQNPELSNRETQTAELVATYLRGLGLEARTGIAKTGVVALLKGGKPGPLIAVRADMDALPVIEETDLPFKSTKRDKFLGQDVGVAHACGHDIHTSVQLGVATVLAAIRADLPGSVLFIFQPAEEGPPAGREGGRQPDARGGAVPEGEAAGGLRPPLLPRPRGRPDRLQPRADDGRGRPVPHQDQGEAGARRLSQSVDRSDRHRGGGGGGPADDPLAQPVAVRAERAHGRHLPRRRALQHHPGRGERSRGRCAPTARRCARRSSAGCARSSTA